MHRYRVTGFDREGVELFALTVDGLDEHDAQLVCVRDLRRTPNGSHLARQAERLEVELVWRVVGVTR
jgi:hypothetical protein